MNQHSVQEWLRRADAWRSRAFALASDESDTDAGLLSDMIGMAETLDDLIRQARILTADWEGDAQNLPERFAKEARLRLQEFADTLPFVVRELRSAIEGRLDAIRSRGLCYTGEEVLPKTEIEERLGAVESEDFPLAAIPLLRGLRRHAGTDEAISERLSRAQHKVIRFLVAEVENLMDGTDHVHCGGSEEHRGLVPDTLWAHAVLLGLAGSSLASALTEVNDVWRREVARLDAALRERLAGEARAQVGVIDGQVAEVLADAASFDVAGPSASPPTWDLGPFTAANQCESDHLCGQRWHWLLDFLDARPDRHHPPLISLSSLGVELDQWWGELARSKRRVTLPHSLRATAWALLPASATVAALGAAFSGEVVWLSGLAVAIAGLIVALRRAGSAVRGPLGLVVDEYARQAREILSFW